MFKKINNYILLNNTVIIFKNKYFKSNFNFYNMYNIMFKVIWLIKVFKNV